MNSLRITRKSRRHVCRKAREPGRTRTLSYGIILQIRRVREILNTLRLPRNDGFDHSFDDCC